MRKRIRGRENRLARTGKHPHTQSVPLDTVAVPGNPAAKKGQCAMHADPTEINYIASILPGPRKAREEREGRTMGQPPGPNGGDEDIRTHACEVFRAPARNGHFLVTFST